MSSAANLHLAAKKKRERELAIEIWLEINWNERLRIFAGPYGTHFNFVRVVE